MADTDHMLREMASNRGCKLVKSRRRTPGVGDYGRYGLRDAASDAEVFGFGRDGLTATAAEIEAWLRKGLVSEWKSSLAEAPADAAPAAPKRKPRHHPASEPEAKSEPKPRRKPAPTPPPVPVRVKPALRIVPTRAPEPSPPAPPPPPPAPERPILKIREARAADAEGIATLAGGTPKAIAARIAASRKAGEPALVAEEGGAILGALAFHAMPLLHEDAPLGRITLLQVAKPARRRGIGRALVEEAEARLADAGCRRVEALAEIELAAAPDFFRRVGWKRTFYRYSRVLGDQTETP
jgi:GNAT superfamily N-acetyltransferase